MRQWLAEHGWFRTLGVLTTAHALYNLVCGRGVIANVHLATPLHLAGAQHHVVVTGCRIEGCDFER